MMTIESVKKLDEEYGIYLYIEDKILISSLKLINW